MDQEHNGLLYPRLLRRVRAYLIDSVFLLMVVCAWMLSIAAFADSHFLLKILALILPIMIIEPVLVAFTGGTPGHHIMGLRIRDASSDRNIGILRATVRAIIRTFLGWLSLIFILVTRRHQALHDYFTSTVVVLRRPETLSIHEKFAPRTEDHAQYVYPSKAWRVAVVLLYVFLSFVVFTVLTVVLLSEGCATGSFCSAADNAIANALSIIWFLCIGAVIVLGWRGLLYGCRRSAKPQHPTSAS